MLALELSVRTYVQGEIKGVAVLGKLLTAEEADER